MAGLGLQAKLHSCRDAISLLSDLTVPGEIITQTKSSFMDLGMLSTAPACGKSKPPNPCSNQAWLCHRASKVSAGIYR